MKAESQEIPLNVVENAKVLSDFYGLSKVIDLTTVDNSIDEFKPMLYSQ